MTGSVHDSTCLGMIWSFSGHKMSCCCCCCCFKDVLLKLWWRFIAGCILSLLGLLPLKNSWILSHCTSLSVLLFSLFSFYLSFRGTMLWYWYSPCLYCMSYWERGRGGGYGRRCAFILIRKSIGRSVGVIGLKGGDALILDSVEFCERENQWLDSKTRLSFRNSICPIFEKQVTEFLVLMDF